MVAGLDRGFLIETWIPPELRATIARRLGKFLTDLAGYGPEIDDEAAYWFPRALR